MKKRPRQQPGTVLRTDDGSLYFIPDAALEGFRMPESSTRALKGLFTNLTVGASKGINPRLAGPTDPTATLVDIGALRRAARSRSR